MGTIEDPIRTRHSTDYILGKLDGRIGVFVGLLVFAFFVFSAASWNSGSEDPSEIAFEREMFFKFFLVFRGVVAACFCALIACINACEKIIRDFIYWSWFSACVAGIVLFLCVELEFCFSWWLLVDIGTGAFFVRSYYKLKSIFWTIRGFNEKSIDGFRRVGGSAKSAFAYLAFLAIACASFFIARKYEFEIFSGDGDEEYFVSSFGEE